MNALARELAGLAGVVQSLLAVHISDEHSRCRGCTVPGTGSPGAPWPCALHFYATAAEQISRQQAVKQRSR